MTTFILGQSIWGQSERDYHSKLKKPVDWGLVKQAPYSNTLHSAHWYQATNWNEKPIDERIKILVDLRKGQSMMGRYMNPPFSPFPTMANYTDRMFKKKMDAIQTFISDNLREGNNTSSIIQNIAVQFDKSESEAATLVATWISESQILVDAFENKKIFHLSFRIIKMKKFFIRQSNIKKNIKYKYIKRQKFEIQKKICKKFFFLKINILKDYLLIHHTFHP